MWRLEDHGLGLAPDENVRPYLKNNLKQKRVGGMAQVAEFQPSEHEALILNSSTTKKKKKKHPSSNFLAWNLKLYTCSSSKFMLFLKYFDQGRTEVREAFLQG
jgi:hypothetical protein